MKNEVKFLRVQLGTFVMSLSIQTESLPFHDNAFLGHES